MKRKEEEERKGTKGGRKGRRKGKKEGGKESGTLHHLGHFSVPTVPHNQVYADSYYLLSHLHIYFPFIDNLHKVSIL